RRPPTNEPTAEHRVAHLRSIAKNAPSSENAERFPFSVPVVRALEELSLDSAVTFFVGENGSGKSTILEGIAAAARLPTVGAVEVNDDATVGGQRALGRLLKHIWCQCAWRVFFLCARELYGLMKI